MTPILFVIDGEEFGGGERGFLQIVESLAREGGAPSVAAWPGTVFEQRVRACGAGFVPVAMSRRGVLGAALRLRRAIRQGRFAIVHSQGARADFFARVAMLGLADVRNVCTVQMPVEGFDVSPARRRLYQFLDAVSSRKVDRFIVVSRAMQRALIDRRGIHHRRVRLIYNGVETDRYMPDERAGAALRASLGIAAGERLIGAVGRLVWQKGFDSLVDAMETVGRQAAARLLIVGDGPLRAPLEQQAHERGVAERVRFLGFRADIPDFLRAIDVLAIPSAREGFPMITLEAMASGTPVVATAIDGIREQIAHEIEGLLVPPRDTSALANALVRVLTDSALGRKLGQAARRKAMSAFDARITIAATKRLYADLAPGMGDDR